MNEPAQPSVLLISPTEPINRAAHWEKAAYVPLSIATIAGLTPSAFNVELHDEHLELLTQEIIGTRWHEIDIVGITGFSLHLPRIRELCEWFARHTNALVVVGGPGASAEPEKLRDYVDVLFVGEAEITWPRFLSDYSQNEYKSHYRQVDKPDLEFCPPPDWCNLEPELKKYSWGLVQSTRGCPYNCDFCDVIYLFGRFQRHKPIGNVVSEIKTLYGLGIRRIFIADDEFIANKKYATRLLHAMVELNRDLPEAVGYNTQLTLNIEKDSKLLELTAAANFHRYYIGVESPNQVALLESDKRHNLRESMTETLHRLHAYGVVANPGFIIGFDADGLDIFDQHFEFYHDAFLPNVVVSALRADTGTRLWTRLRGENRIVDLSPYEGKNILSPHNLCNIVPKGMTREQLFEGYANLLERMCSWDLFSDRLAGFVSKVQHLQDVNAPLPTFGDFRQRVEELVKSPIATEKLLSLATSVEHQKPPLMRQIYSQLDLFDNRSRNFSSTAKQCHEMLEFEQKHPLELVRTPPRISDGFQSIFDEAFPYVYERLFGAVGNKDQVAEGAVRVFRQFYTRWDAETHENMSAYRNYFSDLCDSTSAELLGIPPERYHANQIHELNLPNFRRARISQSVWKALGDELTEANLVN